MKTININNQQYKSEKIVKTDTSIIGYDLSGNELFSFRGISDFTQFTLTDGQNFDIDTPTSTDLQAQIFDLTTQLVTLGVI